jgi:RNA polymerase sigma-70 factor (ECF subfamily)
VTDKPGVSDVAERAFRRHYDQVYRYVRRRTRDDDSAEELTQQVFADAAASLEASTSSPLAWLYTVARRRFVDEVRRNAHASVELRAEAAEPRNYGPEVAEQLRAGLARLPESQRQVVVLKLLRGVRFAEIAQLLDVSEDAAKMRFVRAMRALRAELEREGVEP